MTSCFSVFNSSRDLSQRESVSGRDGCDKCDEMVVDVNKYGKVFVWLAVGPIKLLAVIPRRFVPNQFESSVVGHSGQFPNSCLKAKSLFQRSNNCSWHITFSKEPTKSNGIGIVVSCDGYATKCEVHERFILRPVWPQHLRGARFADSYLTLLLLLNSIPIR